LAVVASANGDWRIVAPVMVSVICVVLSSPPVSRIV
jgi:p-aminobenzoyl-glutamate transporter AbgT